VALVTATVTLAAACSDEDTVDTVPPPWPTRTTQPEGPQGPPKPTPTTSRPKSLIHRPTTRPTTSTISSVP
jgi:hypothetical protein